MKDNLQKRSKNVKNTQIHSEMQMLWSEYLCPPLPQSNAHVENIVPKAMVFRRTFRRGLSHEGGPLMNGLSAVVRGDLSELPGLFYYVKTQQEVSRLQTGQEPLPEPGHPGTTLDFEPPELEK